jgi:hypothetical protein
MTQETVKLYLTREDTEANITDIDILEAREWEDFVIIRADSELLQSDGFQEQVAKIGENKRVIAIPTNLEFGFYGVRVYEEESD